MIIYLRDPPNTPLEVTNDGVGRIEAYLRQQPEVELVQSVTGSSPNGVSGIFSGTNTANMVVQLTPVQKRTNVFLLMPKYRAGILALFRDQPSTQIFMNAGGGFGPAGNSLQLAVVSPDFNTLLDRNGRILQEIQKNPWVVDVYSTLSDTSLENDFVPDPSRLKGTGITPAMIAGALQTYASGVQASTVVTGGLSYPIQVQADPTTLSGAQSLLNLPIYSPLLQTTVQVGPAGNLQADPGPREPQQVQPRLHGKPHHHPQAHGASHPDHEEQDHRGPGERGAARGRPDPHDEQPLQPRCPCRATGHHGSAHVPPGALPCVPRDGRPVQLLALPHLPAPAGAPCPDRRPCHGLCAWAAGWTSSG